MPTPAMDDYLDSQRSEFEEHLKDFLRIPSISTDGQYAADVRRAGQWIASQFRGLNFHTELVETEGHPIVYAESPEVEGAPVVLVYGHYDVQPLTLWTNGKRPRLSLMFVTGESTPGELRTTRGRC